MVAGLFYFRSCSLIVMEIHGVFIKACYQRVIPIGRELKFIQRALLVAITIMTLNVYAQQFLTVNAKKITEKETSIEVVAAVQRDFPYQAVLEYYFFPADRIESEWSVTQADSLKLEKSGVYYTVLLKGKRPGYIYGLYNKEGELQMLKILFLDFANLPSHIRTAATSGDYEGYKIVADKYIKIIRITPKKEYLQVAVEKGSSYKTLVFTSEGEILKEDNHPIRKY